MRAGTKFLFVSLLGVSLAFTAYAQAASDHVDVKTIEGRIVALDWVASVIVVRWFGSPGEGYGPDEVTIHVNDDTRITKGAQDISLADINVDDRVSVSFYRDSFAGLQAIRIVVDI